MFRMKHEGIEGVASCASEHAFKTTWEPLGWEAVSEVEVVTADAPGVDPVDDLNKLTVPKLEELAGARGLHVPDGIKKADLVNLIEGSINTAQEG